MSATAAVPERLNSSNLSAGVQAGSAGALIMGADYRGLGVVRSLGRRGIPVWVIKQGGHLVATTSRYVCRNISWPPKDERRQIDFLLDLADKYYLNGWVLFPTDDSQSLWFRAIIGGWPVTIGSPCLLGKNCAGPVTSG